MSPDTPLALGIVVGYQKALLLRPATDEAIARVELVPTPVWSIHLEADHTARALGKRSLVHQFDLQMAARLDSLRRLETQLRKRLPRAREDERPPRVEGGLVRLNVS